MTSGSALETLQQRVDAIEGGYEFLLAYAAQGLATDEGNANSEQLRTYLQRMDEGIAGLEPAFREVIGKSGAELILHGHHHRFSMAELATPTGSAPVFGVPRWRPGGS